MKPRTPSFAITACAIASLAMTSVSQQAAASLVILSNDSSVSASTSAGVYNGPLYEYVYDSDSDSASQNFAGQTAVPGAFGGTVSSVSSATDPFGDSSTWNADATLNTGITNATSGQVSIALNADGHVSKDIFGSFYDDYLGGGTAVSLLDVTFTLDIPYIFSLWGEHNGTGSPSANWFLTDLGTMSQVSGAPVQANTFMYGYAELSPGTYRLFSEFRSQHNTGPGGHYSSAFTADFYENIVAMPVPPAVWLFGSGLLALFRVSRRN